MKFLTKQSYESMTQDAQVIESNEFGPSILQLGNGHYLKIFRRPRLFSSAIFWPYSLRFVRAAHQLRQLDIPAVKVVQRYTVCSSVRDMVEYEPLPGRTLRQTLEQTDDIEPLIEKLARFLAQLHQQGVYFRGVHFGNVLVCTNGEYGLIDFARIGFKTQALGNRQRARNFRPFHIYTRDRQVLTTYGLGRFIQDYLDHAKLSQSRQTQFLARLKNEHSSWTQAIGDLQARSNRQSSDVTAKSELTG